LTEETATLIAAVVAAAAALVGAGIAARGQRRSGLAVAELASDERAQALIDRYREPLVRAAYDLQSRLYNILERHLLANPQGQEPYIENSTLWLLGQYLGWVEILRREAQFLHLATNDERAELQRLLGAITRALSSDSLGGPPFQIQRSDQRALGELMVTRGWDAEGHRRSDCLGFAAFSEAIEHPTHPIHKWFGPLRAHVWPTDGRRDVRLLHLQQALIDLIDNVDPDAVRFPEYRRKVERIA
jgi:hypothetical protein